MQRGFYNAAQSMLIRQRELNAISNNVANANTAGYRKDEIVTNTFMEELILVRGRRATSNTFLQTYVDQAKANLEQGAMEFTESRFDVAIFGNVYFNVRAADEGVYQTRNGQFELDDEGYLTLGIAGRVQGENGDIFIGHDDFVIDADGVIYGEEGVIDRLLLTYIPPNADVAKIGNNLFSYTPDEENPEAAQMPEDEVFEIVQGAFEKSNVDGNKEMTQAMEVQRMYEASSKVLQLIDTMNAKSASIITFVK